MASLAQFAQIYIDKFPVRQYADSADIGELRSHLCVYIAVFRNKWIGQKSREELIQLLDRPVHLFLTVKVDERWADKREFYGDVGLDFDV